MPPPARREVSKISWQFRYREPHQKREAEVGRLGARPSGSKKGRPRGTAFFAAMLFILRAKEKCRMV